MMTAAQMSAAIRAKKKKSLTPDEASGDESLAAQSVDPSEAEAVESAPTEDESEREKKMARIRASFMKASQ